MYSRATDNKIFQTKPVWTKPSQFKLKSWTDTVAGYKHEARKLALCVIRNRKLMKRPYQWFVTINIEVEMDAKGITDLWTKVCRNLRRQGVVALWVREPTRSNKVHYHLLVSSEISKAALAKAIKESMPSRTVTGWHKSIRQVTDDFGLAHYITKAEIAGTEKRTHRSVNDLWAKKRLLFKPKLKIRKHGTIGSFWVKPARKIWKDFQDVEKKISEGLKDHRVRKIIKHIHKMVGDSVPLRRIERSYGYFADEKQIREWLGTANDEGG